MPDIIREIEIDRWPSDVFTVLADPSELPDWNRLVADTSDITDLDKAEPAADRHTHAGTTFKARIRLAGHEFDTQCIVTEFDRPHVISYHAAAADGEGHLDMRQTVNETAKGSRLEFELEYDLPGWVLGEPVNWDRVEQDARQEVEESLDNLTKFLDSSAGPHGQPPA